MTMHRQTPSSSERCLGEVCHLRVMQKSTFSSATPPFATGFSSVGMLVITWFETWDWDFEAEEQGMPLTGVCLNTLSLAPLIHVFLLNAGP